MNKRIAIAGGIMGVLAGRAVLSRLHSEQRIAKHVLVSSEPEVERALVTAVNGFRSRHFASELTVDETLTQVAQRHAEYLPGADRVGHTDSRGSGVLERVEAASDRTFVEAIEFVVRLPPTEILRLRERGRVGGSVLSRGILANWATEDHQKELLDDSMTDMGSGVVFDGSGAVYAVLVMARE